MGISLSPEFKKYKKNEIDQSADKLTYAAAKDAAFARYKEELNRKLDEAEAEFSRGEFVSAEDVIQGAKNILLKYKKQK